MTIRSGCNWDIGLINICVPSYSRMKLLPKCYTAVNQSINQSIDQAINRWINQSTDRFRDIWSMPNQSINRPPSQNEFLFRFCNFSGFLWFFARVVVYLWGMVVKDVHYLPSTKMLVMKSDRLKTLSRRSGARYSPWLNLKMYFFRSKIRSLPSCIKRKKQCNGKEVMPHTVEICTWIKNIQNEKKQRKIKLKKLKKIKK